MTDTPDEVPARRVSHDTDDETGWADIGMVGQADTLPMTAKDKETARRRRARVDELGGFGFGGA